MSGIFAFGASASPPHAVAGWPEFRWWQAFEQRPGLWFTVTVLLLALLSGCGPLIKTAEYPGTWPARVTHSAPLECLDISGRYKAHSGGALLPFYVFGVADTTSPDWFNLVKLNAQLLGDPDSATVTIRWLDANQLEVVVAMNGTSIARQRLTRLRRSAVAAEVWPGQRAQSFRCDPDGIVVLGTFIHDWNEYRLTEEEKKRQYRRPGKNDVGTSHGYFDFSKAIDGSLVMRERVFFCMKCRGLDEIWRRWEPVPSPAP